MLPLLSSLYTLGITPSQMSPSRILPILQFISIARQKFFPFDEIQLVTPRFWVLFWQPPCTSICCICSHLFRVQMIHTELIIAWAKVRVKSTTLLMSNQLFYFYSIKNQNLIFNTFVSLHLFLGNWTARAICFVVLFTWNFILSLLLLVNFRKLTFLWKKNIKFKVN